VSEVATARDTFLSWGVPEIGAEEIDEVVDTLRSGWLTTGHKVQRFEAAFAEYVGARHAIAVSSCTAGLHLALVARGIGRGHEVLVPTLTFCASANVVIHAGARPVLVDVRPDTLNLDVDDLLRRITPKSRAIIAVDYGGQPGELDRLRAIAAERKLVLIEDAAHAVGARLGGRMVGALADVTAFSFYANKNLSTGEGGMVTTDDEELAAKLRVLSLHGMDRDAWKRYSSEGSWFYEVVEAGYKYNMTDLQAALGLHQLARLEHGLAIREEYARRYDAAFAMLPLDRPGTLPGRRHALHLYPILLRLDRLRITRAQFINELRSRKIGTSVHFIPVHLHPLYRRRFGYRPGDLPVAEAAFERLVSLPLYPRMTERDVADVIDAVREVLTRNATG
jgi:dTDP-4-amino-4,6-dideoxygalactose transaminase